MDSKKEYVEHLCDTFAEPMVRFFQRLYNESLQKPEARGKSVLTFFQEQLGSITEWNVSKIGDEYKIAKKRSGCHYINDLIKAILVTYVKIAILSNASTMDSSKVKLRVPAAENFYHRCIIICAREVWKQPYLLYHKVRSIEMQRNINELESIARKAIKSAIRIYIPLDQLVRDIDLTNKPVPVAPVENDVESENDSESQSDVSEKLEDVDVATTEEPEPSSDEAEVVEEEPEQNDDVVEYKERGATEENIETIMEESDESDKDKEEEEDERRSIEIDSMPVMVHHDTTCDVDKLEAVMEDVQQEKKEEHRKKKLILGSMLINRGRHKLINTARPPKSDAFF